MSAVTDNTSQTPAESRNEHYHRLLEGMARAVAAKGYADTTIADIVREVHARVWTLSLPGDVRADLVIALADIEHALAAGASDKMQLGALCGAFVKARSAVVAARQ